MKRQDMVTTLGVVALGGMGVFAPPVAAQATGVPVQAELPSQDAALPGPSPSSTSGRQSYD
ncbi:MAG: hypothetical protein M3Y22_14015, partial [Pseudomonadota bacterium]|nr:hypothetical protein [Pseudomonadota bacterium]